MIVAAIDPGCSESGFLIWNGSSIIEMGMVENVAFRDRLRSGPFISASPNNIMAIEMIASYGMPVGKEVFETVLWIGRFQEASEQHGISVSLVYRIDVKRHHCYDTRAKDGNIRQALIDKYGVPGTKKQQGVTYGVKAHLWSALALATYVSESASQPTA